MSRVFVLFYPADLPSGSAGATRIVSYARILKEIGYHPVMLGLASERKQAKRDVCQGIECEVLWFPELALQGVHAIKRMSITQTHVLRWLDEYRVKQGIEGILFSEFQGYASFLRAYARKYGIPLFFDAVEWYSKASFAGRFGWLRHIRHSWDMHYGYKHIPNIICISSFLYDHFTRKGCHCIRIPTIVDTNGFRFNKRANAGKLILAYAGVPWGKDDIQTVIRAIASLSEAEQSRIELRLYGVTDEEVRIKCRMDEEASALLNKQVLCFGRVSHETVREELSNADFTVLLRENTRKNAAGFPTKVGESMAAGVPVIANLTSDIEQYLHAGVEGIVCTACDAGACAEALRRGLQLSTEEKQRMRVKAREQAEQSFSFYSYVGCMRNYIESSSAR